MSGSLNQAFIRAYAKERTVVSRDGGEAANALNSQQPEAARQATAGASPWHSQPAEDTSFIVRFDTATVAIPTPHFLNDRRPTAAVESSTTAQLAKPGITKTAEAPPESLEAGEDLRGAIAAQMLQAGNWNHAPIDALMDGFPTPTNGQPAPASQQSPPKPLRTTAVPPQNSLAGEEPVRSSRGDRSREDVGILHGTDSGSSQHKSDVAVRSGYRNREGEIFRLDRPSYVETQSPPEESVHSDSSSIEIQESHDVSNTSVDIEARSPVTHSRGVEENLRRARVRIFNPAWEVDSFQWPDVCCELMQQRSEVMEHVAQHLNTACQEGLQVLAITSPDGGEGRTTVACCLAMLAGNRGLNVAIVDGDIENPSLSLKTNLDIDSDWKIALMNRLPLEEIAVHSIDDQVTLVPLLNPIQQSEMSSNDDRIVAMLQELSQSFDLVILDTGHMNSPRSLVTTMAEQGMISAVVAVIDKRSTTSRRVESCIRRIRQSGVVSIGLVENFAA